MKKKHKQLHTKQTQYFHVLQLILNEMTKSNPNRLHMKISLILNFKSHFHFHSVWQFPFPFICSNSIPIITHYSFKIISSCSCLSSAFSNSIAISLTLSLTSLFIISKSILLCLTFPFHFVLSKLLINLPPYEYSCWTGGKRKKKLNNWIS